MGTNEGDGALKTGKITAVVGGQYGGEGKGSLISYLAEEYEVHVRSNVAGNVHQSTRNRKTIHTRYVPTGWRNPAAKLIIGAATIFDPHELKDEIDAIREIYPDILDRLYIDCRATVFDSRTIDVATAIKDRLTGYMGNGVTRAEDYHDLDLPLYKTDKILGTFIGLKKSILMEGHSGLGKSINYGNWPYNLHNFDAAQLASDCCIPVKCVTDVIMVTKVYPFEGTGEAARLETSPWDYDIVNTSITINKPTTLAINYLDTVFVNDTNKTHYLDLSDKAKSFLAGVNKLHKTNIDYMGTGINDKNGASIIYRLGGKKRGKI